MKPSPFTQRVREIVKRIPPGRTLTYKQVATLAGRSGAARAVGMIMSKNFDPEIPCHRVIGSDGKLHGYNRGGIERKKKMLEEEKELAKK